MHYPTCRFIKNYDGGAEVYYSCAYNQNSITILIIGALEKILRMVNLGSNISDYLLEELLNLFTYIQSYFCLSSYILNY